MATVLSIAVLLAIVGVHALLAAVLTRYFRIALDSDWGTALFVVAGIPLVLLATTFLLSGVFGLGPSLGNPLLVFVVLIVVPLALGALVDVLYVPPPDEYELPDTAE
ncbi:hypothetical protein [Halolamina sp.]|jgi:hypothetical protein|uniref:hypothetical protein n=1 Tax=Halolamina sp. TaxID=1940283 RepID=UPI003563585F